ncbi:MAG: helix-turn-helix transcriptional regulator [Gemmatimonadota bacterium]
MPRLNAEALLRAMRRRNVLFKHQLANAAGISYDRLAELFAHPEREVDEDTVARLSGALGCEPGEITSRE